MVRMTPAVASNGVFSLWQLDYWQLQDALAFIHVSSCSLQAIRNVSVVRTCDGTRRQVEFYIRSSSAVN